jgi:hypothetical protein
MKDDDIVKLNLRLPKKLHRRLTQQAKRNNTSLNTEIINVLTAAGEPKPEPKPIEEIIRAAAQQAAESTMTLVTTYSRHSEEEVFKVDPTFQTKEQKEGE